MTYNLDVKKITKEEWCLANCKERAVYIITNYSRTEKQLRDKLRQSKKYSDDVIDETIKFLKKHKYIDDIEYAKRYIELYKDKYSEKILKTKLYEKGVDKKIIQKALEECDIMLDSVELIKKLLLKKCPDYYERNTTMDIKEKQKIFAFLMRKGFSYEDIQDVMRNDI